MRNLKEKIGKYPIPGWLAGVVTLLYCEVLLQLWLGGTFFTQQLAVILLFALGCGCVLGQALSFIGRYKWGKWTTVCALVLVPVVYLVMFFVQKFFQVFMSPNTVFAGAGNILGDRNMLRETVNLVLPEFWRIALMLLPAGGHALLAKPAKTTWRTRYFVLVVALLSYCLGFGLVYSLPRMADQMETAYNFDTATRQFGLNMSLLLDAFHSGTYVPRDNAGGFVIAEPEVTAGKDELAEETFAPEREYPPNMMNFDFDTLAEREPNKSIADIHRYVGSLKATAQNEYTGLFKGKNLIFITAESLSSAAIDKDLTPALYRMAKKGICFDEYYQPTWAAGTTGGEFSNLTGLVPTTGGSCMFEPKQQDMFLLIGRQLQKMGYASAAYHNNDYKFYNRNTTHTYLGYDIYMGWGNGMEKGVEGVWPQSDLEMVDFTLPNHLHNTPFSLYYMSVSGHCMYYLKGNAMGRKNLNAVEMWMENRGEEHSEPVKCYLGANLELEYALQSMLSQLDEAGILEDTVIVISPDHIPYRLKDSQGQNGQHSALAELYGFDPKTNAEKDRNTLIIWSPCLENMGVVVEKPVYSLDILPTISNLFGVAYDSRFLVGRDALSEAEPLVLWPDYSWKTEKGYYDGLTGVFTPDKGQSADDDYIERIKVLVQNRIHYSREVLERDYFNYLAKVMQ